MALIKALTLNWKIAWRYPSASIRFTNTSPKKYVSLTFVDILQVNRQCHKFNTLCWQSWLSAASESDHFSRVLGNFSLNSHVRLFDLLISKFKIFLVSPWNMINTSRHFLVLLS